MGCLNNPFTFFWSNVWLPKVILETQEMFLREQLNFVHLSFYFLRSTNSFSRVSHADLINSALLREKGFDTVFLQEMSGVIKEHGENV